MKKNKKRILITGIAGFVGSHMADYLLKDKNNQVFGLKRPNARLQNISHILDKITLIDGDLVDETSLVNLLEISKPDQIYHFAALSWVTPSWSMPAAYMQTNAIGTINLLEAMRVTGCNARILTSCTPEEYGDVPKELIPITEETRIAPVNPYAASKVAQDVVCQVYFSSYRMKIIRTRAFNHIGPRRDIQGALASFAYQIAKIEKGLQEPIIKVGNIEARRNFTDVRDMVKAYYLAMEKGVYGELYLIGSTQIYTIKECLEMLITLSSMKEKIKYKIDSKKVRPTELRILIGKFDKFKRITHWEPKIPIEKTFKDILDYWRGVIDKEYNI